MALAIVLCFQVVPIEHVDASAECPKMNFSEWNVISLGEPQNAPQRTAGQSCAILCKESSVMHGCSTEMSDEDFDSQLEGSLVGLGADFLDASRETGVCPYFLAAICALESGWGDYPQGNNIAGLMIAGKYIKFDSKRDCIFYLARLIQSCYAQGGTYYSGDSTTLGISKSYNETPQKWADEVNELIERIENNE